MEAKLEKPKDESISLLNGNFVDEKGDGDKKEIKEKPKKVSVIKLWSFSHCFDIFLIVLGSLVSIISGLGYPFMSVIIGDISGSFINITKLREDPEALVNTSYNETIPFSFTYSMHDFRESVLENCWRYLFVGIAIFFSALTQVICFSVSSENNIHRMRKAFFKALLHQDVTWFDQNPSGTLITKMFDNLERVKEGTGDKVGSLIQSLSQFICGFFIAFYYDWKLTLLMMSLAPVMMIAGIIMSKMVAKISTREQEKTAKAGAIAEEALTSIRTVVAFNGVEREVDRYDKALESAKKEGIKLSLYVGIGLMAIFIVIFGSFSFAFWMGVNFVADGSIAPETVLIVFFSVMMSSMALGGVGDQISSIGKARGSAAAIFTIIDRKPEIDSYSQEGIKLESIKGKITIQDLKFSYPTRPDIEILKGISFDVQPGQTVALVGSSGCGKSTIIQLILRYYNPKDGKIFIDDHEISDINIESLRQHIGLVSQEPVLFDCTIKENIKYGNSEISDDDIRAACRLANIENFINQLPDGYNTMVGERGVQLSGGQKQRIAIARALVRDPKILLLDEATSALDAESEHIVQHALEKAKQNRTTIVIAHRLSTIRNADQIIAMKLGQMVESGKHDDLMAKKGFYYELVNAQVFTDIEEPKAVTTPITPPVYGHQFSYTRQVSISSARNRMTSVSTPRNPFTRMLSIDHEVPVTPRTKVEKEEDEKSEKQRLKEELEQEGGKKEGFRKILLYARPEWTFLALALTMSALSGFMFLGLSMFFTQIIAVFSITDTVKLKQEGHFWAFLFLGIGVFQGTSIFLSILFFGLTSERMTKRLRSNLFKNIMRMDIAYFDMPQHSSGKISTRLSTDTPNVKAAIDEGLGGVIQAVVSLVLGISFSFYYGWQMALVMLAIFPIVGIGQWYEMKYFEDHHEKDNKENENAGHLALQAIENIRTVQALTLEKTFFQKFANFLETPHKTSTVKAILQGLTYAFGTSITYFLYAISFRFGLYLIEDGTMEPMSVMRVLFAISFTTGSIGWAAAFFPEYAKAKLAAGIIFKMLKEMPRIDSLMQDGQKTNILGSIEFRDVQFAYYERPDVRILQGLDLSIKPGQTLAIVGPSGCGKSTVIALLERFYNPYDGDILVDGVNIKDLNVNFLRSHIALVSQEPILFDCSIRENICYGLSSSTISMDRIRDACKLANIADFIENNLPDGYETRVGEKGVQLSGGQKQRIAIARALVRNPKILLLDEATSALDAESEKIVQEALDRASESRTCIVIAHRLSTIVNADMIAVMKSGVVIEQGTHTELLNKRGVYYELVQKQNSKA